MKVVIAIDSFKGSMRSIEAGEADAAGIRKVYSEAKTKDYPLADGPGCLRLCNLGET